MSKPKTKPAAVSKDDENIDQSPSSSSKANHAKASVSKNDDIPSTSSQSSGKAATSSPSASQSAKRSAGSKPSKPVQKRKKRTKPFNQLLSDVTFVLSGYENPYRGDLRQKGLDMGAKCKPDWNSSCTHLM